MTELGLHADNYKWLDPFGIFPTKQPENGMENDLSTWRRIIDKMIGGISHLKVLWFEYDNDQYGDEWRFIQRERLKNYIITGSPTTIVVRAMLRDGDNLEPIRHAHRILRAVRFIEQYRCDGTALWVEIGNEPNHPSEAWGGSNLAFNQWFRAVVMELRNNGMNHGIFYPGLTPSLPQYLEWYGSTQTGLSLDMSNGIALHLYDPMVQTYYDARDFLQSIGRGHYPLILSEVGVISQDRVQQYVEVAELGWPYHIFIADGKSGGSWDQRYIMSSEELNAIRNS